ncbi:hypothetical protein HYS96_01250 [Candidatus Daviesbacteria bacterium]|nr:hypothetical protein [Candidatus Daviesbacteria bacterium]
MKVLLHGNNAKNIAGLIQSLGFEIVTENPDVVISYGGDGTLLSSEKKYPGVPKLPIRDSLICKKCLNHEDKVILKKLLEKELQLKEYKKLHTSVYGKALLALNDFVVRNKEPIHTIRFKTLQDDTPGEIYIGDGIVVSTPFGSTGYFKSITGESFSDGFALAFNNTTKKTAPIYLNQDEYDKADGFDKIGFQLVRGKATLTFDNSPDVFSISEGTTLEFKLSDQVAKIYEDTSLRCPNCKVIRG